MGAALDNQWDNICRGLGLAGRAPRRVPRAASRTVLPTQQVNQHAAAIVNQTVRPRLDTSPGVNGEQWAAQVYRVLAEQRETIKSDAALGRVCDHYHWQQRLAAALEHAVTHALATLGLPYAQVLSRGSHACCRTW